MKVFRMNALTRIDWSEKSQKPLGEISVQDI